MVLNLIDIDVLWPITLAQVDSILIAQSEGNINKIDSSLKGDYSLVSCRFVQGNDCG